MPHSRTNRIRAGVPWDSNEVPILDPGHDYAETKDIVYECVRCGPITRTYAADARPPTPVTCKCGKTARIPGAPDDAGRETPKYGNAEWRNKGRIDEGTDPWSQFVKRRGRDPDDPDNLRKIDVSRAMAYGERLLAERLAEMRQERALMEAAVAERMRQRGGAA